MGKDPDRIRREIEETRVQFEREREADTTRDEIESTRAEMGDTMSALGHKADVKSRVKESVASKKDAVVGGLSSGKDAVVGKADSLVSSVTGVVPERGQMVDGAGKVGISKQNPMGLAIGGAAVGFLVGLLVPSTRVEDEKIGETADQLKGSVKEAGHEAFDRGKQVAQDAVGAATESAKEGAQEQSGEMSESLKESAREVASTGGGSQ
jgi:gas vesicle protein